MSTENDSKLFKTELNEETVYYDENRKVSSIHDDYLREELRLPSSINFLALRETVLAEAPFVKRNNRGFWKKWIETIQFRNILAASQSYIADKLGNAGVLNVDDLNNIHDDPLIEQLSVNVSQLILLSKPKFGSAQDILFLRLPEILCFMIIPCLHANLPSFSRIFNSVKFREIILDWISELVGGLRIADSKKDKDWIFADAVDTVIMTESNPIDTMAMTLASRTLGTVFTEDNDADSHSAKASKSQKIVEKSSAAVLSNLSSAISKFSLEHSPIMDLYLNLGRDKNSAHVCGTSMKAYLSHQPLKPLTTMKLDKLLIQGAYRERKVRMEQYKSTIKNTLESQKNIKNKFEANNKSLQKDLRKIKEIHRIKLKIVNNEEPTAHELLIMAKAEKTN